MRLLKSKEGVIKNIYYGQLSSAKQRGHAPPDYSLSDLKDWCYSQDTFGQLYLSWVCSGFDRWQKPSVDRIDSAKSYSLDNLQLMTWRANQAKQKLDIIENPINTNNSGITGVYFENQTNKYRSEIIRNGVRVRSPRFVKKIDAAKWRYKHEIAFGTV